MRVTNTFPKNLLLIENQVGTYKLKIYLLYYRCEILIKPVLYLTRCHPSNDQTGPGALKNRNCIFLNHNNSALLPTGLPESDGKT